MMDDYGLCIGEQWQRKKEAYGNEETNLRSDAGACANATGLGGRRSHRTKFRRRLDTAGLLPRLWFLLFFSSL